MENGSQAVAAGGIPVAYIDTGSIQRSASVTVERVESTYAPQGRISDHGAATGGGVQDV
jgi:hypothetical protein